MEKIVNKKTSIFKENKLQSKIAKITFMFIAILCLSSNQYIKAQEQSQKIKLRYSKGKAVSVKEFCRGDTGCRNIIQFNDSINPPSSNRGWKNIIFCGKYTKSGSTIDGREWSDCTDKNVYEHTFSDGSVMYSTSSDPNHFNNREVEYIELDVMDILKAMPEIGISRVDPNLIEY